MQAPNGSNLVTMFYTRLNFGQLVQVTQLFYMKTAKKTSIVAVKVVDDILLAG